MRPGSSAWREAFWASCKSSPPVELVKESFGTQGIVLAVARPAVPAFHALFDRFDAHGYQLRRNATGTYNCRLITGGQSLSSHAFGIALDANWDTNPYTPGRLITDMPKAMTDEIQEIRTVDGVRVWRWGGDWDHRPDTGHRFYDAMHYEVIATPDELLSGILRSLPTLPTPQLARWPVLRGGARGPAVRHLQERLVDAGFALKIDGDFGPNTAAAVGKFQLLRGLNPDGVVGPATWTALEHHLRPLGPGALGPMKRTVG